MRNQINPLRHFTMMAACAVHCGLLVEAVHGSERIGVEARINDKRLRLFLDTGASHFILFRPVAERLGLRITNPPETSKPTAGTIAAGVTEPCKLTLWNTSINTRFRVVDAPQGIHSDMDGVLGWLPLQSNVFFFDGARESVKIAKEVPPETLTWMKFPLSTNNMGLEIDLPGPDRVSRIIVDTGMQGGVFLNAARWRDWISGHSNQPSTMSAVFNVHDGLVTKRESWAEELSLGPLRIRSVPVSEASAVYSTIPGFEAALGVYALRRLDLVVDGPNKVAYARPVDTPASPYRHNRLGAVFVPRDMQSDPLVALVIKGSPADLAGIRNGDLLLKIGDLDTSKWRSNPAVMPLSRFWDRPAGTKLNLTLKRGEEEYQTVAVLREILGPNARAE